MTFRYSLNALAAGLRVCPRLLSISHALLWRDGIPHSHHSPQQHNDNGLDQGAKEGGLTPSDQRGLTGSAAHE